MAAATEVRDPAWPRLVARALAAFPWFVVGAYAAVVVLRFVAYDHIRYLAFLNAQTLWFFLPAYMLASAAFSFRRFVMGAIAAAVVAFHIISVVPSIGRADSIPEAARDAPRLRVVSANVRWSNPTPERLARELLATDADVLLLQEVTSRWLETFSAAGFDERYPFQAVRPREESQGQAIYSRRRLRDVVIVEPFVNPTIAAEITVGGEEVSLVDVHIAGPTQGMSTHRASAAITRELVRTRTRPRVVAGDFNATPYNRTIHRMKDLGLESAHEQRGRGLAVTWPNGNRAVPPIRLDHVFVDPALVVLDVRELRGSGSDHKPVLVDLAVL